jgi:hypothetical protein
LTLTNLHYNYEVKNGDIYFFNKFQKRLHVPINEKHKQAQAISVCLPKRTSLFTMCITKNIKIHYTWHVKTKQKTKGNKLHPWVTKWTPIKNVSHEFIYYSYFAPLKYIHPINPKHNNFMDSSSLISPPLLSNAFIIISMRLIPNPSTILSTQTKRGTLVQQSITYAWTHIHD